VTLLTRLMPAEFIDYKATSIPMYAREKVSSGEWAEADSMRLAHEAFDLLLPNGLDTPENHLFGLRETADGPLLGVLWFAIRQRAGDRIAYVYEIVIHPEFQRRGHASGAFRALEDKVREMGLSGIALHVFGHNTGARALYESLGYQATNITMFKPVG
jgi:ribosomal protein S18 acetylase RimI-like enzyme